MKDIQSLSDDRRINIRKVGVKTISYPVKVLDKEKKIQETVAKVNMYVNLPHRFKGTHMSRFVEILNRFHGEVNLRSFHLILQEMKQKLEAEAAHVEMEFPYFLQRRDNSSSLTTRRYECRMHASLQEVDDLVMEITVPIMLLASSIPQGGGLPRSMGRWGTARVAVRFQQFIWLEDLIALVEKGVDIGDSPPDSVETLTRKLGEVFAAHKAVAWYSIFVENFAEGFATFASVEGKGDQSLDQ